jgi:anti-sigma B factor antagonist
MTNTVIKPQIATVEPQGYISAANAPQFLDQLTSAVATEENEILLVDMKEVEFLDSAGLMVLVKTLKMAQNLGRRLIICSLAPSVRMVFELTQLDRVFEIFDSRHDFQTVFN